MSELKARLTEDMKVSMKAKDKPRLSTIRLALSEIKQREVDERKELTDADVLAIIDKMVKQRRDSASQYDEAGRDDLASQEKAEIEVLVECKLPSALPSSGLVAVNTLQAGGNSVQVGYEFGGSGVSGFATVPPALAQGMDNYNRTDRAPVMEAAVPGGTLELNLFVDGDRVETFFAGGVATITTVTSNRQADSSLSSSFVNTAGLDCAVTSWVLGL